MSNWQTRALSSPGLRADPWLCKQHPASPDDEDAEFYIVGDRVLVDGHRAGSVAYFGEVEFASGDWLGVVLDEPTGNHAGKLHGRKYFQCEPKHGLFVRPSRVSRARSKSSDSAIYSSNSSSRNLTPSQQSPADNNNHQDQYLSHRPASCQSTQSSLMESYFYDDDYRLPSLTSLARKLRNIEEYSGLASREPAATPSPQPAGILKKTSATNDWSRTGSGSRSSSSISRKPDARTVFNFRPKREQLYHITPDQERSENLRSDKGHLPSSSKQLEVGDRVLVRTEHGCEPAFLRYLGETDFATGQWAGVELDTPDGKNDGSILSRRYFKCDPNFGLFVPFTRVTKISGNQTPRTTIWSPPPTASRSSSRNCSSSSPDCLERRIANLSRGLDALASRTRSDLTGFSPDSVLSDSPSPAGSRWRYHLDKQPERKIVHEPRSSYVKFDDRDIETQLRRSLSSHNRSTTPSVDDTTLAPLEGNQRFAKSVKYTFSSSKYDGNPIARRTVEYAE